MKQKITFKKLVTNLPYNPSLITQVSFYAKRLKQESSVRRLGFAFIALTFFVQLFAVIAPPQSSSAQDLNNDLVPGGFSTQGEAIQHCLSKSEDYGTILANYNINCDNVLHAHTETINSADYGRQLYSMGRLPYGKTGEYPVSIAGRTYYMRYLWAWDGPSNTSSYQALVGTSASGAPFMILYACGNLVIVGHPTPPPPPPPAVKSVNCTALFMTVPVGSEVKKGAVVGVRGQLIGSNMTGSDVVDMYYDYINTDTGKVMTTPIPVKGVHFTPTGLADDLTFHNFTMSTPGHYQFRLLGTYNGNMVGGSFVGACAHPISVATPPVDVCKDIPGTQTEQNQCKPCTKAQTDQDSKACVIPSKTATNDTQTIANADGTTANAGDLITYTLSSQNTGKVTAKQFAVQENISDILDYADVTDAHGGIVGKDNIVRWPAADIKAGATLKQKLTIKVKSPIPNTPVSISNPGKFDLVMNNVYGNAVNIKLPSSVPKTTEAVTTALPNTGPGSNIAIAFTLTVIVGYFFARSRLLNKELNIVRHEYGAGA